MKTPEMSIEEVRNLIPEYYRLSPQTTDDIVFYGKANIESLIKSWQYRRNEKHNRITKLQELMTLFDEMTPKKFKAEAAKFEDPVFPYIGRFSNSPMDRENEPLDCDSRNRQEGTTTFNVCGWCKHTGGGSCRYQYHISTYCSLMLNAGLKNGYDSDKKFNSPCVFKNFETADFKKVLVGLKKEKEKTLTKKKNDEKKIRTLLKLKKLAEEKPVFPSDRNADWFDLEDKIVCFVGNWKTKLKGISNFQSGKVINGYRHHDGCVSVKFKNRVHNGEYLDGHGGGFGISRPEIMKDWEFEYLLKHPKFAGVFVREGTGKLENHNPDKFLLALAVLRKEK